MQININSKKFKSLTIVQQARLISEGMRKANPILYNKSEASVLRRVKVVFGVTSKELRINQ